jgi:hypothetical protein
MSEAGRSLSAPSWSRDLFAWLSTPAARRVAGLLLVLLAGQLAFAAYEAGWLDLPLVREGPPGFAAYQLLQTAFALSVSGLLVAALVAARARPSPFEVERCSRAQLVAGLAALAAAAAATGYFLVDPAGFHAFAQEDRPLEWSSALLLLGAGGLLAVRALNGRRDRTTLLLAGGLCLALFVVGMEEISWGQRLFGFSTPEKLAEMNWQSEFNFHNVQTDLSETVYYFGAGVFLILLPLLRDLLPASLAGRGPLALAPHRSVALVGAPIAIFNYGHWNLLPVQLSIVLALWALLAWARGAAWRGDRGEQAAFLAAAGAVLAGQLLFLAYGSTMADLPDATEYKEFFIALGFAWYAGTVKLSGEGTEHRAARGS